MRQAGRTSAVYRALRETHGVLGIAKTPELAAHVALLPVAELGVDAAILFADLLLVLEAMGLSVRIEEDGPVIEPPIRTPEDVASLRPLDPEGDLGFVLEAIRRIRAKTEVPLIGFAGAPFTLASYAIEGRGTREFLETKRFMHGHPDAWRQLMALLADGIAGFLRAQALAGAQALQLFDSWVGALSPWDYATHVQPYSRRVFDETRETSVPRIHFGTGTAGFLDLFHAAGGEVLGVDWRIPLDAAWKSIGEDRAIQGNLDPAALLGPADTWRVATADVLRRADGRDGHVFNLGHGVLPETPQEHLVGLVRVVHEQTVR
jgi:uroporphyrinogen decarboxylase